MQCSQRFQSDSCRLRLHEQACLESGINSFDIILSDYFVFIEQRDRILQVLGRSLEPRLPQLVMDCIGSPGTEATTCNASGPHPRDSEATTVGHAMPLDPIRGTLRLPQLVMQCPELRLPQLVIQCPEATTAGCAMPIQRPEVTTAGHAMPLDPIRGTLRLPQLVMQCPELRLPQLVIQCPEATTAGCAMPIQRPEVTTAGHAMPLDPIRGTLRLPQLVMQCPN